MSRSSRTATRSTTTSPRRACRSSRSSPPADLPFPGLLGAGVLELRPEEYREAQGTSFATPQVSAAAAVLLEPPSDAARRAGHAILRSSAVDSTPATGCAGCAVGRDPLSDGGGSTSRPRSRRSTGHLLRDRYEANDDAGSRSYELFGMTRRIDATVDFWDDQDDVYAIHLNVASPCNVGQRAEKRFDLEHGALAPAHGLDRGRRERGRASSRRHAPGRVSTCVPRARGG